MTKETYEVEMLKTSKKLTLTTKRMRIEEIEDTHDLHEYGRERRDAGQARTPSRLRKSVRIGLAGVGRRQIKDVSAGIDLSRRRI